MSLEKESLLEWSNKAAYRTVRRLSSDEWCEEGSSSYSSNSFHSGSCSDESYIANWEDHVCPNGTLFYAEYLLNNDNDLSTENTLHILKDEFVRSSTRRNSKNKGKFVRFVQKPERKSINGIINTKLNSANLNNENFMEKIVEIIVDPKSKFNFGRRATLSESLLGISVSSFPNSLSLMVTDFMVNIDLYRFNAVEIGDWLKSINDLDINSENINEILSKFTKQEKIVLKFQRLYPEEQKSNQNIQKICNFSTFSKNLKNIILEKDNALKSKVKTFSLMIFSTDLTENDSGISNILFSYPQAGENDIFPVRGSFLTLNAILKTEFSTEPQSTNITKDGIEFNICYATFNNSLIIIAAPIDLTFLKELQFYLNDLMEYFQFYLSYDLPISELNKNELTNICEILEARLLQSFDNPMFEKLLPEPILIPLPKEAQLRINDALNEMEAMDYRDWNQEPLNSHREFFISGCALYFNSYLLTNHFNTVQLKGVHSFLRCRGVFNLIEKQAIRDLVVWIELPTQPSNSRTILAIVCRGHLLLAVTLQSYETEKRLTENGVIQEKILSPSLFYIEEIQDTLDHLRHGGITSLTRAWIQSNKRPEVMSFDKDLLIKTNGLQTKKRSDNNSIDEIRASSSIGKSSIQSLTHSEDSNNKPDDGDSDSDWDGFPHSHKSSNGFDFVDMEESFLKEISDILPSRITAGKENVLINYIQIDFGSGIILTSPDVTSELLRNKFRIACNTIHTVLQNTKRFRKILSQESSNPSAHKSFVAIKEHGILVTISMENKIELSFWVIGRLFTSPTKELYVCHRSDIPQNLVEIAFRLSFLRAG